jgi:hypothetical protein
MDGQNLKEWATDAIRYWEPRRLAYNTALAAVVLTYVFRNLPASRAALGLDSILSLFVLAVLANIVYCSAYVADIFAQASAFRDRWRTYRWILLSLGITFAGVLTRFFTLGMLRSVARGGS